MNCVTNGFDVEWCGTRLNCAPQGHGDFALDADMQKRPEVEVALAVMNSRVEYPAGTRMGHAQEVLHDFGRTTDFGAHNLAMSVIGQQLMYVVLNCHGIGNIVWLALRRKMADWRVWM